MNEEKRKPVHTIRVADIEAAIWENSSSNGTFHMVTFCRKYDDQGELKNTHSFRTNDLPTLGKVSDLAFDWMRENRQQEAA